MKKKALTKVLALAMAVAMTGSLIGCGNDAGDQSSQQSSESTQEESQGGQEESSNESEEASTEDPGEETPESADQPLPEWEAYDCNGATIRLASEQIFDGITEEDKEKDAAKYEKRWEYLHALEVKYNCKFEAVTLKTSEGVDDADAMLAEYRNGLGYADIFCKGPDVMLKVRDYLATVEDRDTLKMSNAHIDAASWNGVDYGFTYDNLGECFVLAYSRDYLKSIGMEETPGDLFMRGEWSFDDAMKYLSDLQSKLNAANTGAYAIALHTNHYGAMAGGMNGVKIVDSNGNINLDDPNFIESLNFYNQLQDAGVAAPITGYTMGADYAVETAEDASMPYSHKDICGYSGGNTHAIAMVENWQQGDMAANNTNWGIVPFPWGPNVKVTGTDENGLPVLDNYFVARTNYTNVLISGAEYRGEGCKDIPDWVLFQIVREYEDIRSTDNTSPAGLTPGSGDGQAWINAYTAEKNGEKAGNLNYSPNDSRSFTNEEDLLIWNWMATNVQVDYVSALANYVPVYRDFRLVIAADQDGRTVGEALKGVGEKNMADEGLK